MSGFAKVFSRITESSLMEQPIETRYVFMTLLTMADPQGHVIGTDVALSRRINVPLETFQDAVARLKEPDADSNSPAEEGRRLVPSDKGRGYRIVNYVVYRNARDDEHRREYMRNFMAEKRRKAKGVLAPVSSVSTCEHPLAQAEAEAEAEAEFLSTNNRGAAALVSGSSEVHLPGLEPKPTASDIYEAYPNKVGKPAALRAIEKAIRKVPVERLLTLTKDFAEKWAGSGLDYCPKPTTWFDEERYNDNPATWGPRRPHHAGNVNRNAGTCNNPDDYNLSARRSEQRQ